jgi:hypothetical protein
MDDARIKDLTRRYGDDLTGWPEPHRREALAHLQGTPPGLTAALAVPVDEAALSQAVLTRLSQPTPRRSFALPAALGYAALILAFGWTGYGGLGSLTGDPVLALALGDTLPGWVAMQ